MSDTNDVDRIIQLASSGCGYRLSEHSIFLVKNLSVRTTNVDATHLHEIGYILSVLGTTIVTPIVIELIRTRRGPPLGPAGERLSSKMGRGRPAPQETRR
jgi:hypothetical protein